MDGRAGPARWSRRGPARPRGEPERRGEVRVRSASGGRGGVIRVGVLGATGRMGRLVSQAVVEDPDLVLVAAISPTHLGESIGRTIGHPEVDVRISDELDTLLQA